jgi:PAS domain S-box-containing protein
MGNFVSGCSEAERALEAIRTGLDESLIAEGANAPRISRKRSDEVLAAERLAHSVIEQAAEAIVVCDERGRVVRASRAAADLCGRNPLRRTFDEVFALDFPSGGRAGEGKQGVRPRRMAAEVLDGKVLWAAPATLRRPDGSQAEVLVSATALQGPDDVGCVVNLVEITELSRAQRALQESEAHFRSVLENSLDAAYRRDLQNDRLDYLSPAIQALNGFTVEEMFAMSADEVLARTHPDDLAGLLAAVKAAERSGELRVEYRFKAKDGQYRWLADRAVMIKGEDGRLRYRSGVMRDITASKQAEEALRESEQRFRLALKNAPVSVAAQDRDLRFLWAFNHRTVDSADVIGKTDADLFPPDDSVRLMALKRRAMESGTEVREQLWVTSNGQRVFLDLCLEPMRDAAGRVVGVGVATVDLTERKKAEEALARGESSACRGRSPQERISRAAVARAAQPTHAHPQQHLHSRKGRSRWAASTPGARRH